MENNEVLFLDDIDIEKEHYYEVELWNGSDCDGHFFRTHQDALSYFNKHKKHSSDCVKIHYPEKYGGHTELIKENRQ